MVNIVSNPVRSFISCKNHLPTPTTISIESPKYEEVSEQRTRSGSGVLIYLELKLGEYLLINYKVLYELKKPPANTNKDQY